MKKQHSNDYKLSAVKLYLKLKSIRKVCNLIDCKKSTLHRWIERYFETGYIKRKSYKSRKTKLNNTIMKSVYLIDQLNVITNIQDQEEFLEGIQHRSLMY
jgi:transposase